MLRIFSRDEDMLKPRNKALRRTIPIIVMVLILLFNAVPLPAQNIMDYFTYTYSANLSKTDITGGETFSVTITGTATCSKDLWVAVSDASMTGRIVAEHQTTGARIVLNPSYNVTISPFPNKALQTAPATRVVSLQFPADSQPGSYRVVGELIDAQIYFLIWFNVTQYLPARQSLGSLTLTTASAGGGGGGEPTKTPAPSPTSITSDVSSVVSAEGVFSKALSIQSTDSKAKLSIDEGTKALAQDGAPISKLTMAQVKTPRTPPPSSNIIGLTYDFGPSGATFSPPINLTLTYDPKSLPQAVDEKKLVVAWWDASTSSWVNLTGTVDPVTHTITASVSHFTDFTILAYTRPASFTVTGLSIAPAEANINQDVTVSFTVTNTGDLAGSYTAVLKIDEAQVATRELTLAGGEKQQVTFTTSRKAAGRYSLSVDGLSGTLVVKAAPPTPEPSLTPTATAPPVVTPAPPPAPAPAPTQAPAPVVPTQAPAPAPAPAPSAPFNWWLIVGIIAAVIVIGAVAGFLLTRKRR